MFKPNSNRQAPVPAKPKESTGPQKLAQLWNEPTVDNIQELLAASKKRIASSVIQPFSVKNQDSLFQISVQSQENGDPVWRFERGTLAGLNEVWSLPSIDIELIHNLVLSECTGQHSVDLISATSGMSRSSTGNITLGVTHDDGPDERDANATEKLINSQAVTQTISGGASKAPVVSLEGDLEKLQLSAVIQSLTLTKVTGRVEITSVNGGAELYIVDGALAHATTGDAVGDNALVELLAWESGKFKLYENERPQSSTIKKRIDTLLMEGAALLDQHNYLKAIGLKLDTFLVQAFRSLSEQQFEQTVQRGPQVNMQLLKDLYLEIDGYSTLYDLLRRLPLTRAEWVPLLFNLTQVGLITLAAEAPLQAKTEENRAAPDIKLDEIALQAALRPLQRTETEIFNYPLFQYFVKQELARFEVDSKSFALIVFDLLIEKEGTLAPMPLAFVKVALQRVKELIREIDMLGHFETLDYGLLLPQTTGRSATVVAQRIAERLKGELIPGMEQLPLNISFGVAAVPQDTKSPGGLMMAAAEAKRNARKNKLLIAEYRTMS